MSKLTIEQQFNTLVELAYENPILHSLLQTYTQDVNSSWEEFLFETIKAMASDRNQMQHTIKELLTTYRVEYVLTTDENLKHIRNTIRKTEET